MASEFCVQIRLKFYEITSDGRRIVSHEVSRIINEMDQKKLTTEQKVHFLYTELQSVSTLTEHLEKPEYYGFASDEQFLFKLFSSRFFCNNKIEEQALSDGWMLYEKHRQIQDLFLKAQVQLPPFTFSAYMANEYHFTFYEHNQRPPGTSSKEYRKIQQWQTLQKETCAVALFHHFQGRLLTEEKNTVPNKKLLQTEFAHLERIFSNAQQWNANLFVKELFKLKGLTALFLNNEINSFHREGSRFFNGDKINKQLCPAYFQAALKDISGGILPAFPVFGMSLYLYHRWLNKVISEQKRMDEPEADSYSALFEITYQEGLTDGGLKIDRFAHKNRMIKTSSTEYEAAILTKMDKLWAQYNKLACPYYFNLLDHKQQVKDSFISDCLKSLSIEKYIMELKQSIVIHRMIAFLNEELSLLKHNPLAPADHQLYEFQQLTEILAFMAPDPTLMQQYMEAMIRIRNECHTSIIPVYFIKKDITKAAAEIFRKAVINLKAMLEKMSEDNLGYFCNMQHRELKYLELLNVNNQCATNPYLKHLKKIFKDESNNIKEMKPFKALEIINLINEKEIKAEKPISFGYHHGPRPPRPIVVAMNLEFGLFGGDTTVDDFMEVITCKDLSKNTKIINWAAKYNIIDGFIKRLKPWCPNLKPAVMEHSGIFIRLGEGPLKAMSLYKATPLPKEIEDRMDAIFKAKYR